MELDIAFNKPYLLLLLATVPLLWIFSFRSLSGLGTFRRLTALGLRSVVLILLICALAEMQFLRTSQKLSVIYVLDQSMSVPAEKRAAMVQYVVKEVSEHRNGSRGDLAGVIAFGRDPAIEVPPYDDILPIQQGRLESLINVRVDATNIEAALKLAQAMFPEDAAKRIVIITDGNETAGDAEAIAKNLVANGIGIDIVPVELSTRSEVAVEKIALPEDVRKGQPIQASVVLNNMTEPTADDPGNVQGKLVIVRKYGKREDIISEQELDLPPGKKVLTFQHTIDRADFYTYEARFVPKDKLDDSMTQNNTATAFTHVQGQGSVLLIEDWENPGEFAKLIDRLRANNIEVDVMPSNNLFSSLAELQRYDSVLLANVPRSSGSQARDISSFSDQQINILVRNTQQMGCGLVMLGGPQSFGAGGWANSELEKAMPVDFTIKDAKVVPVGALVLIMHASELAQGNYWQKVVGRESIKSLGYNDYCGLLHWNGTDQWLWGAPTGLVQVGPNRTQMLARLGRMAPGDMPAFDPSMKMALAAFNRLPPNNVAIKHMIIISDGDPPPPNPATLAGIKLAGIKITTVAIGTHGPAGSTPLRKIATATGGKYYVVTNPKALPRIYQREARRIAQPLIKEHPEMIIDPSSTYPHEIVRGFDSYPAFDGYVMTTVKDNPLVDVVLAAPVPAGNPENATVLATWTYGLGRSVAFTSDAGKRWTNEWTSWDGYDKFFTQMIRWSMRPAGDQGQYTVSSEVIDGKVRVVVTAMDKEDNYLNFLNVTGNTVGPDMQPKDFRLEQKALGRYVGEFEVDQSGSYFMSLVPGPGQAPIRTGVNVPYSAEFRQQFTNTNLLESLAGLKPEGGEPGKVITGNMAIGRVDDLLETNTFRHNLAKAISSEHVWPILLVICAVVFLPDVFIRRVTIGFEWLTPIYAGATAMVFGSKEEDEADERMDRLRMSKERVTANIDERKAAARFEMDPDENTSTTALDEELSTERTAPSIIRPDKKGLDSQPEEEDYTSRLLRAKQKARKNSSGDQSSGGDLN
ncbi:MAG: glutamine amidotransferase [Pirellulales bacterium]